MFYKYVCLLLLNENQSQTEKFTSLVIPLITGSTVYIEDLFKPLFCTALKLGSLLLG
jgi:hypothetical protein